MVRELAAGLSARAHKEEDEDYSKDNNENNTCRVHSIREGVIWSKIYTVINF